MTTTRSNNNNNNNNDNNNDKMQHIHQGGAEEPFQTIFEPFRIKTVEAIHVSTREERRVYLDQAHYNLFKLKAEHVLIDLLTDSGTGAMSSEQWAAVMHADESYAGATSYFRFEQAVQNVFGFDQVIPCHQGRAAEHLLFKVLLQLSSSPPNNGLPFLVPNNTHFDTTRANIEERKAIAVDLPCKESDNTTSDYPFKGNMNVQALEQLLLTKGDQVPFVMMTVTNNAEGAQPVSLENLRAVHQLCRQYGKPFYIDACRFAENAWLIHEREDSRGVRGIVNDMMALADGCTMSAKKDGMSNIGGFLALRDTNLAQKCRNLLVVTEGFHTYGGMSGRDMESIAQGLYEAIDEQYLKYRIGSTRYVVEKLKCAGVPVLYPSGGHAVFLDASEFLPHIPWQQFPGQALVLELYLEGGIRSCEIGSVMLPPPARHELVRLAIPRRTYTQSHMDYLVEVIVRVWKRRQSVRGVRITEAPPVLRHFSAHFAWV